MNKICCTSPEQSKKLIELGIDVNTADMWYQHIGWKHLADNSEVPVYFPMITRDRESDEDIPAWSLNGLMDILAKQDFRIKCVNNQFNIDIPSRHCKIWFPSLLEAAFEMVVYLLKENKI